MKRILAILAFILTIPILFIALLMVILSKPESYRDEITASVKTATGYELLIKGDISWRYWPPIALEVEDISLGIPGANTTLMTLENAAIDLDLLPIITGSRTISVSGLAVHGLIVRPVIDKRGRGNWEIEEADTATKKIPGTTPETTPPDKTTTSTDASPEKSSSLFQLHIADIDITDAVIEYRDESSNDQYRLEIISLATGPVDYDSPIAMKARFEFEDPIRQISATGSIDGTLLINSDLDQVSYENFIIVSTVKDPDSGTIGSTLTLTGEVDLSEDKFEITQGLLQIREFQPTFSMTLENMSSDEPQFSAELTIPSFNPRVLLDQFQVEQPETADANALTQLSFNGRLAGNTKRIEIKDMSGRLDKTTFNGSLILGSGNKTDITFDLVLDEINASSYLASDETEGSKQEAAGTQANTTGAQSGPPASVEDSELIPVALLAKYDVSGTLTIASLLYDTYSVSNFKLDVQNKAGQLHSGIVLDGYDGNIRLDINSAWRDTTSTNFKLDATGLDLVKLIESESITGKLNLDTALVFKGTMMSEFMATLNGASRFSIKDGTLNVTTLKRLVETIDALRGKQSGIAEWPDKRSFKVLKGVHSFRQGTRTDQKLEFTLENLVIKGKGGFDYFANQLSYDLTATITESSDGGFEVSSLLADVQWPIHCEGSLDDSASDLCRPDKDAIESLVVDIAKQELKRKVQSELDKIIEDKAPKEIKDLLKGLFRR